MIKRFRPPTAPHPDGLFSIDQAAAYLGLASGTLRHWVSAKRIAYVKVGKLTKFRKVDLDDWIEQNRVDACNG